MMTVNLSQSRRLVRLLVVVGWVGGFPFVAGCQRAEAPKAAPLVPVKATAAIRHTIPITQNAIGSVQALRTVAVRSQLDGIISEVHFHEGDEVKVGDLLVTLDRRPFENSLRIAKADLGNALATATQAESNAARYRRLDQQQVVSKEQYTQLLAAAESARAVSQAREAAVANAELQLGYTEIRAPIPGRTGQCSLHEGALVKAGDATQSIVVINQLQPISVAYSVPESVLPAVRQAQAAGPVPVVATPHAGTGANAEGRLDFIDNTVDASTGMIVLKAVFPNTDRALWPGQFVDMEMRLGAENDVVLVPETAVQNGQRGPQVFVVKTDQTADLRTVRIGRTTGGLVVIQSGVEAGETVVTDGQLRLVPGSKVELKP